jgi:hypothetical protein
MQMGAATIIGNSQIDLNNERLPKPIKKATLCAMNDVLATSIETVKR